MAHFAELDSNNTVLRVVVVNNSELIDPNTNQEDEIYGLAFCKKLWGGTWVQTSYNGNMRKNYAGIGYTYDKTRDAFIPPQPYASWTLDEETCRWNPPIARPELTAEQLATASDYRWNEDAYQADNTTGWELITP